MENKEPVVGFRVGAYIHGKTCVAPVDKISNVPERMKRVVNVSVNGYTFYTCINCTTFPFFSLISVSKI